MQSLAPITCNLKIGSTIAAAVPNKFYIYARGKSVDQSKFFFKFSTTKPQDSLSNKDLCSDKGQNIQP